MSAARPGRDGVVLTAPQPGQLCNSLACARAGRAADVIVTHGILNDLDAGYHHPGALWRESWHKPVPICGDCWEHSRQVAISYCPALVITDTTQDGPAPAAPSPPGAGHDHRPPPGPRRPARHRRPR